MKRTRLGKEQEWEGMELGERKKGEKEHEKERVDTKRKKRKRE